MSKDTRICAKKLTKGEDNVVDTKQCKGCRFWNKTVCCCDYMDLTGLIRPRDGDKCLVSTKKSERKKVRPAIRPLLAELGEMRVAK